MNVNAISDTIKLNTIRDFYRAYYNTDQDIEEFAPEFYYVVGQLLNANVVKDLEKLTDYRGILNKNNIIQKGDVEDE